MSIELLKYLRNNFAAQSEPEDFFFLWGEGGKRFLEEILRHSNVGQGSQLIPTHPEPHMPPLPVADPGFPRGGTNPQGGGTSLLFGQIHGNEKKLDQGARPWHPLDPPMITKSWKLIPSSGGSRNSVDANKHEIYTDHIP